MSTPPPRIFRLCMSCQQSRPVESLRPYKNSAGKICYCCHECRARKVANGAKVSELPSWAKSGARAAWEYACGVLVVEKSPIRGYHLDFKVRGLACRHYTTLKSARTDCTRQRIMLAAERILSQPTKISALPQHILDKLSTGAKQQDYYHIAQELARWVATGVENHE